ncbi:hypothetical protein ACI3LX_003324 [Candidozyma auris]
MFQSTNSGVNIPVDLVQSVLVNGIVPKSLSPNPSGLDHFSADGLRFLFYKTSVFLGQLSSLARRSLVTRILHPFPTAEPNNQTPTYRPKLSQNSPTPQPIPEKIVSHAPFHRSGDLDLVHHSPLQPAARLLWGEHHWTITPISPWAQDCTGISSAFAPRTLPSPAPGPGPGPGSFSRPTAYFQRAARRLLRSLRSPQFVPQFVSQLVSQHSPMAGPKTGFAFALSARFTLSGRSTASGGAASACASAFAAAASAASAAAAAAAASCTTGSGPPAKRLHSFHSFQLFQPH